MLAATALGLALCAAAWAQGPEGEGPALREVTLPAGAFTRDPVLPAWVDPLPLPPVRQREPVLVPLLDRQVQLQGAEASVYAETAIQINEPSLMSLVGMTQVSFAPAYQRLVLQKAHLVRDGRVIDLTAQAVVRFMQPAGEAPEQSYTGQVAAALLLDDLRVGDVVHLGWRIDGNNPVFGEHLSFGLPWDSPMTTLHRRVRVLHPAAQPLQWRMLGDAGRPVPSPTTRPVGELTDWRIEERDVPAAAMEPGVPDDWYEWRVLQLSTYPDWVAVSRWVQALFAPDPGPLPEELEALLARARALPDDAARVQMLLDWVQREIRYFALAIGESSHRPHPPALVLQRRWGDCKDKTQLLLTLLHRLDIAAEPVLVSQRQPRAPGRGLPTPVAFDHVIARVRLGDTVLHLDATRPAQGVALRALAQPPDWVIGLVADGQATAPAALVAVPAGPVPSLRYQEHVRLDTLGPQATMELTLAFGGAVAERNREGLRTLTPAQLRTWALAPYERRHPGATLVGEPRLEDDLQANRLTLHATLRLPEFARAHAGGWRAPVFPTVLAGTFNIPPTLQRQYPLRALEHPFERGYTLIVDWPEQVSAGDDPQHRTLKGLVFDAQTHRSFRGARFSFELALKTTAADVAAADVPKWMRELEQLMAMTGGDIIVLREEIVAERRPGESVAASSMRQRLQGSVDGVTRALADAGLQGTDRADALCARATALAALERHDEAARDAAQALQLDERSADVWHCQGVVAWRRGDFARAEAAFTRAQSLGAEGSDALFQRGMVRLLMQNFDAAAQDFQRVISSAAGDGGEAVFARINQAVALRRADQPLPAELQAQARRAGPWPQAALALMVDATTPEALLQGLQAKTADERELALSEAWYYIGQWHLARGERDAAVVAFQHCVAQRVTGYIEHAAAVQELRRLQR